MALTRKMLSAMGIEADKIDQIIEGHSETVTALNNKIDEAIQEAEKYKAESAKVAELNETIKKLENQIKADAKEREGKDYDKLKSEFEEYKADVERKAVRANKEAAYKEILKDAGIPEKHFAKILKYSNVDGVELDDKGKITTAKDILKSIKEEWSDHIQTTQQQGAQTSTPPTNTGGKRSKADIMKIKDPLERQQAIADNMESFGY